MNFFLCRSRFLFIFTTFFDWGRFLPCLHRKSYLIVNRLCNLYNHFQCQILYLPFNNSQNVDGHDELRNCVVNSVISYNTRAENRFPVIISQEFSIRYFLLTFWLHIGRVSLEMFSLFTARSCAPDFQFKTLYSRSIIYHRWPRLIHLKNMKVM